MALLSDDDIRTALDGTDWRHEGGAIVRDLEFGSFAEAIAFVDHVAGVAEKAGHHPDILVHGFNKVRLTCSTHTEGGVTRADLDLAREMDGR